MESEKRRAEGITYGGGSNLTGVYETGTQAAEKAVDKWVNSPDHFKTMTKAKLDNIGVGVAEMSDGALVCFQFFGNKSSALGTYS